jgi:hypothetical protein
MLHEADPTGEIEDPPELGGLEGILSSYLQFRYMTFYNNSNAINTCFYCCRTYQSNGTSD